MRNATHGNCGLSSLAGSSFPGWRRWVVPSLSDCLLAALLVWLLVVTSSSGASGLLSDAGAGVHIRTGEWILDEVRVPREDIFSFSRPDAQWFAWEWLSDVGMALAYRTWDLPGVVVIAAALICLTFLISIRHMLWRGGNALAVVLVVHLGIAVCSTHLLARPHVFTLLLMAGSWWLLDHDRHRPTPWVWVLIPVTALWANLHGGFTALIVTLAALGVGTLIESALDPARKAARRRGALRYAGLLAGCLGASLANPYGYDLHRHLAQYLRSEWIRRIVLEFQAPKFNSSGGAYLEMVLFAAIGVGLFLLWKRQVASALVILGWAHASLHSVRHFTILYIVLAPALTAVLMDLWRTAVERRRRGLLGILYALGNDHQRGLARNSTLLPALVVILLTGIAGSYVPRDFPAGRYLAAPMSAQADSLASGSLFTTDYWADYLIYRNYPFQRVFLDGRTDFFGQAMAQEYLTLLNASPGWNQLVERYEFDRFLLPAASPLAEALRFQSGWQAHEFEPGIVLYERSERPASGLTANRSW